MTKEELLRLQAAAAQGTALAKAVEGREADLRAFEGTQAFTVCLESGRNVCFLGEAQEVLRRTVRSLLRTELDDLKEEFAALQYPPPPPKAKVQ